MSSNYHFEHDEKFQYLDDEIHDEIIKLWPEIKVIFAYLDRFKNSEKNCFDYFVNISIEYDMPNGLQTDFIRKLANLSRSRFKDYTLSWISIFDENNKFVVENNQIKRQEPLEGIHAKLTDEFSYDFQKLSGHFNYQGENGFSEQAYEEPDELEPILFSKLSTYKPEIVVQFSHVFKSEKNLVYIEISLQNNYELNLIDYLLLAKISKSVYLNLLKIDYLIIKDQSYEYFIKNKKLIKHSLESSTQAREFPNQQLFEELNI